jgi:CRP/FNR family transcriptional regulator, cyclic AMP receptor protein
MPDRTEIIRFLKEVPLLASLTDAQFEDLADHSKINRYKKGALIVKKYSFPSSFFIIKKGVVVEIGVDANDFSTIINTHREHDYLGETGVLLDESYITTAKAGTDAEVISISKEYFCNLVFGNIKVNKFIIKMLCHRLQNSAERIISFLEFNSEGRIAYRLLTMAREYEDGNNIKTTQEALSQVCGVARQTVSNMLSGWKKQGVIETHRGYIEILSKEELMEIFLHNSVVR